MSADPAVLKAYVDLVNSERQAIWARNSAMLVANSLLLNVATSEHLLYRPLFCAAGIIVCVVWGLMTHAGWKLHYEYNTQLRETEFEGQHPFRFLNRGHRFDVIRFGVFILIGTMAVMYVVVSGVLGS